MQSIRIPHWGALLFGFVLSGTTARCSCESEPDIQRASVGLRLLLIEPDPCLGRSVTRRVPDDYAAVGLAMVTDFGSRAERVFEVRAEGTTSLTIRHIGLAEPDEEFSLEVLDERGAPAVLPIQLPPTFDADGPPALRIRVAYASADSEPDLAKLLIQSDDPERSRIEFGLSAGRGRLEVCAASGCASPAVAFGNVTKFSSAEQTLTLKNVGEGDLDVLGVSLNGDTTEFCAPEATSIPNGVPDCNLVSQCKVLKPGEEYRVTLRYRPVDGGPDAAVVRVTSGDATRGAVEVPVTGAGAGPALCPCLVEGADCNSVNVVDFGFVDVGSVASRTVRLVSCGTEAAQLSEAVLEDDPANFYFTDAEFLISSAFTTGPLAPGAFAEGTITYSPSAAGQNDGGLRFRAMDSSARSWIGLLGRAATCDLDVLPPTVDFGTIAAGNRAERTVVLTNNGGKACLVQAIGDPSSPAFTLINKPSLPLMIAAAGSYDLTVRYTAPVRPSATPDTGTFDVTSDEPAPDQTITAHLAARGGGTPVCAIDVQPTGNAGLISSRDGQLRFGAVSIGYNKTIPIRITNVGNTDCQIVSHRLNVSDPGEFNVRTMPLPSTIAPAATETIEVTFAPTHGLSSGQLGYTALFNYVDFRVSGPGLMKTDWSIGINAQPTVPTIDIIPTQIDFGVVTWERPRPPDQRSSCGSEERHVRIYNSGNGALEITSISIDGTSDPVFEITRVVLAGAPQTAPYRMSVPSGGNAEVTIRFWPTRTNPPSHSGLLVIENSVTTESTVPLTGVATSNGQQTDIFQQLGDNKVDVLWVIDDSCSMSEEQTALANNIQRFTNYATMLNADWQMGVITTEVNEPAAAGKLWACNGFSKVIRRADADPSGAFRCAANVTSPPGGNRRPNPSGSDSQEAGLGAARIALEPPIRDMENAGFLRPDARLAVIIVSDEEDQSQGPVSLYVDFFRQIKGFRNPQLVSVSAISGDVPGGCATAEAAPRYRDAASQLGGQFESVCNVDWSMMLANIGLDVFALRHAWSLSRPADASSISVRVDGVAVSPGAANGWTYDASSNNVSFNGSSIPAAGARIEISYGARCIM